MNIPKQFNGLTSAQFDVLMSGVTNRPVYLKNMFRQGLTIEQAKEQCAKLAAQGESMFIKRSRSAQGKVPRRHTRYSIEQRMRLLILKELQRSFGHRMAPDVRAWVIETYRGLAGKHPNEDLDVIGRRPD